jgi:hypothetical protein
MNRTTTVVVALIAAASLSTMVYAIPEQRAMAHPRLHLLGPNFSPDAFPFGPNSPDPPLSPSKSDPPPSPPGITTQNLANGAVTTPKIASGAVSMNTTQVLGSATRVSTVPGTSDAFCPSGTVVTGGGYLASPNTAILINARLDPPANGWGIRAQSSNTNEATFLPIAACATIHP